MKLSQGTENHQIAISGFCQQPFKLYLAQDSAPPVILGLSHSSSALKLCFTPVKHKTTYIHLHKWYTSRSAPLHPGEGNPEHNHKTGTWELWGPEAKTQLLLYTFNCLAIFIRCNRLLSHVCKTARASGQRPSSVFVCLYSAYNNNTVATGNLIIKLL